MKKVVKFNVWIMGLSIISLTVLGVYTLQTKGITEINFKELTIKIEGNR